MRLSFNRNTNLITNHDILGEENREVHMLDDTDETNQQNKPKGLRKRTHTPFPEI